MSAKIYCFINEHDALVNDLCDLIESRIRYLHLLRCEGLQSESTVSIVWLGDGRLQIRSDMEASESPAAEADEQLVWSSKSMLSTGLVEDWLWDEDPKGRFIGDLDNRTDWAEYGAGETYPESWKRFSVDYSEGGWAANNEYGPYCGAQPEAVSAQIRELLAKKIQQCSKETEICISGLLKLNLTDYAAFVAGPQTAAR